MDRLWYKDVEDFADSLSEIYKTLNKDDFEDVSVIAKYEEAKELLACLVHTFEIVSIEMHRPDLDDYYDEYLLSINNDGVWVAPFKRDGKYLHDESTVVLVLDNCSSACIPHCKGNVILEVGIGEDYDECCRCCCEDCKKCKESNDNHVIVYSDDETGSTHGFTASKSDVDSYVSYSYYSSDVLDKEDIAEMLDRFGF